MLQSIGLLVHTILYSLLLFPQGGFSFRPRSEFNACEVRFFFFSFSTGIDAGRRCLSRNKHAPNS